MTSFYNKLRRRTQLGSTVELIIVLPLILGLGFVLISLSQVYYTHNITKQLVNDTANKVAVLFRREFFNNGETAAQFTNRVVTAINNENPNIDTSFLGQPGGITITFTDLSGQAIPNNTYDGALALFMDNGMIDTGGNNFVQDIRTFIPGGGNLDFVQNCNDGLVANTDASPMFFRSYNMTIRFQRNVDVNLIFQQANYTIDEQSSVVVGDLTFNEICDRILNP